MLISNNLCMYKSIVHKLDQIHKKGCQFYRSCKIENMLYPNN